MISNVATPKLNPDWFVRDGAYAKVKTEFLAVAHETIDKMYEARTATCAQAREHLQVNLTAEQKDYLSSTYDPEHMSYSEYRAFVDDLCKFGYFAEEDKPLVSCGADSSGALMMIPLSYYPLCGASYTTDAYVPGQREFPFKSGNVLSWTKHLSSYGTLNPQTGRFEKTEQALLFEKLRDVLQQIGPKKAVSATATEKSKDTLELAKDDASFRALLGQLTPSSKTVLDRIQAGTSDITKDEWSGLCKELESLGAISEADLRYTSADFHFIPLGYYDEKGEFVKYELPMELKNKLLSQVGGKGRPSRDGLWACLDDSGWTGDPLAYLDNWMSSLYTWRSDLAWARNGDGSPKYSDFSPMTNQINSCQKVADLVKELSQAQM